MNTSFLLRRVLAGARRRRAGRRRLFLEHPQQAGGAVVLKTVERGKVESTVVNTRAGTVEACLRTRLSTIMGGRIEYLGVKEGDKVKKGQLLLKLWNDDQKAQQGLAEAQRRWRRSGSRKSAPRPPVRGARPSARPR
jgi:multidrug efflux pump subunit AcrA (membrane-fusion protein)